MDSGYPLNFPVNCGLVSSTLKSGFNPGSKAPGFFCPAPALQEPHIHLARQGAGVEALNHVFGGACVARQGEHVNALTIEQPKRERCVAQRIEGAALAVRIGEGQFGAAQNPFEPKIKKGEGVFSIAFLGQKKIVGGFGQSLALGMSLQLFIDAHRWTQGHDGPIMFFGLR